MFHRHKSTLVTPELTELYEELRSYAYEIWSNPAAYDSLEIFPKVENPRFNAATITAVDHAFSPTDPHKITKAVYLIASLLAKHIDKNKAIELIDVALNVPQLNTKFRYNVVKSTTGHHYLANLKNEINEDIKREEVCNSARATFHKV